MKQVRLRLVYDRKSRSSCVHFDSFCVHVEQERLAPVITGSDSVRRSVSGYRQLGILPVVAISKSPLNHDYSHEQVTFPWPGSILLRKSGSICVCKWATSSTLPNEKEKPESLVEIGGVS